MLVAFKAGTGILPGNKKIWRLNKVYADERWTQTQRKNTQRSIALDHVNKVVMMNTK